MSTLNVHGNSHPKGLAASPGPLRAMAFAAG
jgi:hypothetical protein